MSNEILLEALENLLKATTERDEFEVKYELEKADLMFSSQVTAMSNQSLREAQLTKLMNENGMYELMAKYRSQAKKAYYIWATYKALKENK